jgi:hypothetical protein
MSDPKITARKNKNAGPVIPRGHVLGEFQNYADAGELVNKLVQNDFAAAKISIIGYDPVLVERVRSKLGYGRVALSGSLTGFWLGLLFALLLGVGFTQSEEGALAYQPQQFAAVLILAAGVGMLINVLRFGLAKNKRGFLSTQQPVATRYEVLVPNEDAAVALKAMNNKSD